MFYFLGRAIRLAFCWLDWLVATVFMYLLTWLPRPLTGPFYPALFRHWCAVFVRALGVDLLVHQRYGTRLPGQFILIANHPSAFEDIGIPASFPVRSLAKLEVKDWWVFGRIGSAAGTLYVKRERAGSRNRSLRALLRCLHAGDSVAIYPEGGCKGRRIHGHFEPGAFAVSMKTGIPIVPVFLVYEAQEAFEWRPEESLLAKAWQILWAKNKRANYHVFDPIWPQDFTSVEAYTEHVYQLYLGWQQRFLE